MPGFVRDLDRRGVRFLSYSKLAALEFCPYRYLLEFVRRVRLRPPPDYFVKGSLFHEAVARLYRGARSGRVVPEAKLDSFVDRHWEDDPPHLKNALRLACAHQWRDCEVLGVEEPFVLEVAKDLPPLVGVVDLLLRKGSTIVVVDHKTGKRFGEPDEVQLAIYREHARRTHGAARCALFFDQYRWVSNLDRIRKPAFQRDHVSLGRNAWREAIARLREVERQMAEIEAEGEAGATGECWVCPYRQRCDRSAAGSSWGGGGYWF